MKNLKYKAIIAICLLMVCFSVLADNVKTQNLPDFSPIQPTDKILITRGTGANSTGNALAASTSALNPIPGYYGQSLISGGNGLASTATAGSSALANQRGYPSNQWAALNIFGDASSYNGQYVPLANGWGGVVSNQMGAAPTYYVLNDFSHFDCDVIDQKIVPNVNPTRSNNPLLAWLPTPQDGSFGNLFDANHLADVLVCHLGALTWSAISRENKVYAQNWATTGSWSNSAHYTLPAGITSTTNGSTATGTITTNGGPIYLGFLINSNNGGAFTWTLDSTTTGAVVTQLNNDFTYCGSGSGASACGQNRFSLGAVRVPPTGALAAGSHTVRVAVTSTTTASNSVTPEYLATPSGLAYSSKAPAIVQGGQVPLVTGYSPAVQASAVNYNNAYQAQLQQLTIDGLTTPFVNLYPYYNNTADISTFVSGTGLNSTGFLHIGQAFNGVIQATRLPDGSVSPLDYGASNNAVYFNGSYSGTNKFWVIMNAGSPTISIPGYQFMPGDVGKVWCASAGFSTGADEGPCTYIASVNTVANTATAGANMAVSTTLGLATMGGKPTDPSNPATAQDDTVATQIAGNAALLNGGVVTLPQNNLFHNLVMPGNIWVKGNGPGDYYFSAAGIGPDVVPAAETIVNCGFSTGPSDTQQCIQTIPHTRFSNFMIRCISYPAIGANGANMGAAAIGYSTQSNSAPGLQILLDHISYFGCPVDVGMAYGFNYDVSALASVTSNGDGATSTMNVSSITSTAFLQDGYHSDFLALGRTATIAGTKVTITAAPAGGTAGNFTIDKSLTVSSTAVTFPRFNIGLEVREHDSQHLVAGFAYNGVFTDSSWTDVYCTGTFMQSCLRLGPGITNYGNGSNRWKLGRIEEVGGKHGAVTCDGCGIDILSADMQFNGTYNIATLGSGATVQYTGGTMYGGGHCHSADQDKAMVSLGGTNPYVRITGVNLVPFDVGSGCTVGGNQYLFSTSTGATGIIAAADSLGSNMPGSAMTGLYNATNGAYTAYEQNTGGWPLINTTQPYTVSGGLALVTTSLGGGASFFTGLAGSTTASGAVETISGLKPVTKYYDCAAKDVTTPGNTFQLTATTSTSCALTSTSTTNSGDLIQMKAMQGY